MELVNSILRAMKILEILERQGKLSFVDLHARMDYPKSTLYKIISTLEQTGVITKEQYSGRYMLGVRLIELGNSAKMNLEIRDLALPVMKELHEKLDYATIHLLVMVGHEVMVIESYESANWYRYHFTYSLSIGVKAPLHCTGGGKAILAFMERSRVIEIINATGLKKFTEHTITNMEDFLCELDRIKKSGYAVSNAEHDNQIRTIAAPIFNSDGNVLAALSVLGLANVFSLDQIQAIAKQLMIAAHSISANMGYKGTFNQKS